MQKIIKIVDESFHKNSFNNDVEDFIFYSQRNFQRVFKKKFNETLRNFKMRLRLETAYKKIIYADTPINFIAFEVGYESTAAFTKSFKKHFGISPTQARKSKKEMFNDFIEKFEGFSLPIEYEILFIEPKNVYYKILITNNYDNEGINKFWRELEDCTKEIDNYKSYGLIIDQPLLSAKDKCRYEACIDVNPQNKEFLEKNIFGRKYIKFIHKGSYDTIENTYRQIYYQWLYKLDFQIDSSPIIEVYVKDSNSTKNESDYLTEILFPIKQ